MTQNPYQSPASVPPQPLAARGVPSLFAVTLSVPLTVGIAILLATNSTGRFINLFFQATPFLLAIAWPISVPAAIWMVVSFLDAKKRKQLDAAPILWLVPLMVIPFAMLVWGAVFENPRGQGYQRWQLTVVEWALWLDLLAAAAAIWANHGRRAFIGAATILLLLYALSCSITAGSAVTGDWL